MIGKLNNSEKESVIYLKGKCDKYDDITIDSNEELEAGEYIAYIEIDWC